LALLTHVWEQKKSMNVKAVYPEASDFASNNKTVVCRRFFSQENVF